MAFWRDFNTKPDLEAAVRAVVNPPALFEPFVSDLISDLIYERHYYFSKVKMRPLEFRKDDEYRPYRFTARFGNENGWVHCSWRKCLNRPKPRALVVQAFRRSICEEMRAASAKADRCELCGVRGAIEMHHVKPTIKEISEAALHGVTEDEIRTIVDSHDWSGPGKFMLPVDHPVQVRFTELHQGARLKALCHRCHLRSGYRWMRFTWADLADMGI